MATARQRAPTHSGRFYGTESIPYSRNRRYEFWLARRWLNFGAEPTDQAFEQVAVAFAGVAPYLFDDCFRGQDMAAIDHQAVQQAEFEVGQLANLLVGQRDGVAFGVQAQV